MYKLNKFGGLVRKSDNASIPTDVDNSDYQLFLAWVAAGNAPDPFTPSPEETASDLEKVKNVADTADIRADAKFQALLSKTPAQARNWVDNNFPTLTVPERKDLATLVVAVCILGRRL